MTAKRNERTHKSPTIRSVLDYDVLKAVVEDAADFIFTLDAKGRVVSANRSASKPFGMTPVEIRGKSIFDLFPKELATQYSQNLRQVFRSGKHAIFEDKMVVGTKELWINTSLSPVKNTRGTTSAVMGVCRDITSYKIAENKLKENEERYRSLFDSILDGVYLSTHEGRFVDVNHAFVKMFGYSNRQEMLAIADIKKELYFSPDERGSHILDSGKDEVEVYRMRRKDGSEIWVEDHGRYIHDDQGRVIYHEGILRDITERRRTEQALRESELKYRALVEDSPNFIGILQDGILKYANTATVGKLGWNQEELTSTSFKPLETAVAERFRGLMKENVTKRLRGQNTPPYEISLVTKTGQEIPVLLHAVRIVYEGRPAIEFSFADVTEQKRMQDELKRYSENLEELIAERSGRLAESEERYRRLFESAPVSLWEEDFSEVKKFLDDLRKAGVTDLNSYFLKHPEDVSNCARMVKVLNVNETTLKLYDAKTVGEITDGLSRILSDGEHARFRKELVALAEGKRRFESEFDNRTLTGVIRHVDLILSVVPGYEDTLERVLVSVIDLTTRDKLERELRSTRDQLEQVLATNPAVLFFEEPLPDFSDTFSTFVSESARFVLGFESNKFVGKPGLYFWRSRVHPDDLARYQAELQSLWADGHHLFDYRFLHGDGKYRWIAEQYKVVRDTEGRILNAVSVAIDVTERKQLEEKLARTERLATIGETAAMVGHDLRNPLQGIAGAIHLMKQDSLAKDERDELLQLIENSVSYANSIVRDLMEFSAEIQLRLVDAMPESVVKEAVTAVRVPPRITLKNLSQTRTLIKVDQEQMRRVFINLIENAIDAMPQKGTLTISTQQLDGKVEFTFSDTGGGMPPKILENLWKPLQTTKAKGMGLGLAICKRIVEAHGGTISVRSSGSDGTTFVVQIPIRELEVKNN